MTRSRRWALPAALGLASACLLAPAAAYTSADEDPIELGADASDPQAVAPGTHQLVLPKAGDEGYLRVERQIPDSTMWLGQTFISQHRVNGYVHINPEDDDSNKCLSADFEGSDYHRHKFMSGVLGVGPRCAPGDDVTFQETSASTLKDGGEAADVAIWEEPPPQSREVLPPPSLEHTWDPEQLPVKGDTELGATYAQAPDLTGGRWDVHIDPGEPALFRADLDWNQHLQVDFTYQGKKSGNALIYPILISPIGGYSAWGQADGAPSTDAAITSYPDSRATVVSPSITWRNREATGVTAAFPGTYYVLLRLGTVKAPQEGANLTLSTKVVTDKEPQSPYAPEYQDSDAALPPDIGGHRELPKQESSAEDATPWAAVGGLFGGAAVMSVAGGVALRRHRRSLV